MRKLAPIQIAPTAHAQVEELPMFAAFSFDAGVTTDLRSCLKKHHAIISGASQRLMRGRSER
jgi:hypothetical protein